MSSLRSFLVDNLTGENQLQKSLGKMEGITFDANGYPMQVVELDSSKFK